MFNLADDEPHGVDTALSPLARPRAKDKNRADQQFLGIVAVIC